MRKTIQRMSMNRVQTRSRSVVRTAGQQWDSYGGAHLKAKILCYVWKCQLLRCVWLCDLMDCSHQALLPMGFFREEYWSRLSFPSLGDLPDSGRDQTHISCISCIGRQILYHCATWEAINHHRNVIQNHSEMLTHSQYHGRYQKTRR